MPMVRECAKYIKFKMTQYQPLQAFVIFQDNGLQLKDTPIGTGIQGRCCIMLKISIYKTSTCSLPSKT